MVKKTLLSLAIAATAAGLAGCNISSVEKYNDNVDTTAVTSGQGATPSVASPIFSVSNSDIPLNTDFLFADAADTDGTANTDDTTPPVTTAINKLVGFSTLAPFYIEFNKALDPDTVVANQTVFLIPLKNAEDDASIDALDLTTIVAAFPSNPFATTPASFTAEYVEMDDGETPAIRVTPTAALNPKTKYLVALTDSITDADGEAVMGSAEYRMLAGDNDLLSSALEDARTAVQGWEQLAGAYIATASSGAITQDDIVLSYAFTTGAAADVMKYYAAPATFLRDAASLDLTAATAAAAGYGLDTAVDLPQARDFTLISPTAVDSAINAAFSTTFGASPAVLLGTTDTTTRFFQGQLELPDFSGGVTLTTELTATGISTAMASDADWSASDSAGDVLETLTGAADGTYPPTDEDGTTNVTYRFPFAEEVGTNYAPVLITAPDPSGGSCGTGALPVLIYVHGITGDRTNSLGVGAAMAANCIVTVAIDLPLHGVAPQSSDRDGTAEDNSALAFNADPDLASDTSSPWAGVAAAYTPTFDDLAERHNSVFQDANGIRQAMDFTSGSLAGESGSAFINLYNFSRVRDNLRQAVADLLNLNASLSNISTAINVETGYTLDLDKVYVAGHSLGSIVAADFVAVNNDADVLTVNTALNEVQGVVLANGGSHLTKLLENSPAFGPTILAGLSNAGIEQGASDFEKYMYVFQSMIDSVDPGANAAEITADSILFEMVGGGNLPADTTDTSLPSAYLAALTAYPADHTVPNFDYFADADTNPYAWLVAAVPSLGLTAGVPTAAAPLAGTDGLASVMGLETVNSANTTPSTDQVLVRLQQGTHSTFAAADDEDAFTEMMTETVFMIGGAGATVTDTTVLEQISE